MAIQQAGEVSPREHLLHEWETEIFEKQAAHAIKMKEMELEIKREDNQAKIELKKLESKWASWLRLPGLLIRLPYLILFGFAYIVAAFKKYEPPKKFWDLLQ